MKIKYDFILQKFEYEKLVKILLFIVSEHSSDEGLFVQRAGIMLLNSLAVQVDGPQKLLVGNLGAMEKMLEVIRTKLNLGNNLFIVNFNGFGDFQYLYKEILANACQKHVNPFSFNIIKAHLRILGFKK